MTARSTPRKIAVVAVLACLAAITFWEGAALAQRRAAGVQTLYGSETPVRCPARPTREVIRRFSNPTRTGAVR